MSTAEVVSKAIGIVAAIDRCGCQHCLELLEDAGLRAQPQTDDNVTNPGTNRIDQEDIR